MNKPTPQEIKQARKNAGLTQSKAAELVHMDLTSWQKYEAPVTAKTYRPINMAVWELFLIKTAHDAGGIDKMTATTFEEEIKIDLIDQNNLLNEQVQKYKIISKGHLRMYQHAKSLLTSKQHQELKHLLKNDEAAE